MAFEFDLSSGALVLDFANTVGGDGRSVDHLTSYDDLLDFAQQSRSVDWSVVATLRRLAAQRPPATLDALGRATELREALYRLFAALADGDPFAPSDLALLSQAVSDALCHATVRPSGQTFAWTWRDQSQSLDGVLWPIVRSAADLLTDQAQLSELRICAGDDCRWLFLDTSKNRSRRWCDMKTCGNRAKARRFQARQRALGRVP